MSEHNGVMQIPSGLTTFALPDGGGFDLDLIEACRAIDKITLETQGKTDYEYIDLFRAWIAQQTDGQVNLTPAQTDWLIDAVRTERVRQKKEVADTLRSLSSTVSTPSSFPAAND